jgi:hypothetical protein
MTSLAVAVCRYVCVYPPRHPKNTSPMVPEVKAKARFFFSLPSSTRMQTSTKKRDLASPTIQRMCFPIAIIHLPPRATRSVWSTVTLTEAPFHHTAHPLPVVAMLRNMPCYIWPSAIASRCLVVLAFLLPATRLRLPGGPPSAAASPPPAAAPTGVAAPEPLLSSKWPSPDSRFSDSCPSNRQGE